MPFAVGQHTCIGMELAQIELVVALACILKSWRFTAVEAGPQPVRASITLTPADAIDLILEPR